MQLEIGPGPGAAETSLAISRQGACPLGLQAPGQAEEGSGILGVLKQVLAEDGFGLCKPLEFEYSVPKDCRTG